VCGLPYCCGSGQHSAVCVCVCVRQQANKHLSNMANRYNATQQEMEINSPGGGTVDSLPDEFINCPVCNSEYNAPKVLPCLHSFCLECLDSSLSQSQVGPGQAFLCPICKTQCEVPPRGVRAMKSNIFLVTLQEFIHNKIIEQDQECEVCDSGRAARKKCIECNDWMCNQCCSAHSKVS